QQVASNADEVFTLTDCWLDGTLRVKSGGGRLLRCAIREIIVDTTQMVDELNQATRKPVVAAAGCPFESVTSPGLAELTFTTVLASFKAPRVWTSDSLFAGTFDVPKPAQPWHKDANGVYDGTPESAIRYGRVPPAVLTADLIDPGGGQPQQRLDF